MKKFKNWNRKPASVTAWAACAATCALGIVTTAAQDAKPGAEEEKKEPNLDETVKTEADYRNWFTIGVGGNFTKGDAARFKRRYDLPQEAYGGVESFHYEQDVGKKGLLEVDGRGIFDNEDYSLRINLENPDWGYVRAGYREYRDYYDGSAGYLPSTQTYFHLYDEELAIDRGEAWFEGQLALPEKPKLTFRYSHQFRDGQKDSTSWGDTTLGGQPQRNVVPAFWDIDEDRDIFALDVEHSVSETDFGVGLRYESSDQDNSRNMRRQPLEAANRYVTQQEGVETDLFNIHAFTYTPVTETILFTTGYSFTSLDTDIFGSRIYGSDYDPIYDPTFTPRQNGFINLAGGSRLDQHVANLNLMLTPWDNIAIVPSFRVEVQDQDGVAQFVETTSPATETPFDSTRDRGFLDVSEGLEARFTGLTNWVFYTRGEWLQGEGDLTEREINLLTSAVVVDRDTESTRFTQKYVAGANWYPLQRINTSFQYYFKSRRNEYDHRLDNTPNVGGNRYPAYIRDQDFDTHDVNVRVSFRPFKNVSIVSRYDFQISTIHNRMDALEEVEGSESVAHIFSESITWTPLARLYLQGTVNWVLDQTETPISRGETPLPVGVVQDSSNDYINISAMVGYALTEKTDLQAQYFLYYANNWEDNSALGVPYNADAEEHGVSTAVIHKLSPRQQVSVRYAYFTNTEDTYGGYNDYEAHMVYSSYQYRF